MIEGVKVVPLKQFHDERGKVMHMLKATDDHFDAFGEVYFSAVHGGAIKGWHRHKTKTLNYAVPAGKIKLVLFDDREESSTKGELQEMYLSPEEYQLVSVPPQVWNGFKGVSHDISIVANCATKPYSDDDIERLDPIQNDIPYNWEIKHG